MAESDTKAKEVPSDKNVSEDKADTPKPEDSAVKFEEPSDKDQGEKKSSETKEDVANVIIAPPSQDGLTKSDENTDLTKPIAGQGSRPRSRSRTSDPRLGVDLAFGTERLQDLKPLTVGQLFKQTVKQIPDGVALMYKEDNQWKSISYTEYYNMVIKAAKSFTKIGVEEFQGVCILGFNSPEWVIANLGAMFAGALPAGIYTTNNPEACHFVANNCKATVILVENKIQLEKILQIRDRLPHLKAIVQYKGKLEEKHDKVYEWSQFMKLGNDVDTSLVENKIAAQKPHQCALLIYTSGTTGAPKAVMLSHDNLTWTANCLSEAYGKLEFGNEHTVSYLPLSHMAAQMADIYLTIIAGGTVHFADPDALKGSLVSTLRDAQPTIFFGVPRVYEKFMESIQEKSSHVKGIKRRVSKWAAKKGIKGNYRRQSSGTLPMGWNLADKLVFKKVREALGFQRCKIFVVGSAPTRQEVHEFFMSYDMPLMELYGMSESSGPQTFNVDNKWRTGSCGPLVPGAQLKIHKEDKNGEGEICYYGRHVFMGYLNNEEKTKEAIDEDGWLHSGDIGKVDQDGFLYITGRIKELIITSGGENIAPVPIENRVKSEVPFLSNVFIVGDKRKYLSCLVTLLTETDPETGEPLDELSAFAKMQLEGLGSHNTTVSSIRDPKDIAVYDAIQEGIQRANLQAISNAQRVQKFAILPKDFSIVGGELGPTLKVRRPKVLEKYAPTIETMYTVTYLYAVVKKD